VIRILPSMHFVADNEPLGLVDEAQRRREQYKRYIERRVAQVVDSPPTKALIERQVADRVQVEVRRRVAERTAARLKELRQLTLRQGPPVGKILLAVARASGFEVGELCGPLRTGRLVKARHVAVLLVSELRPDLSTPNIGHVLGGRDHSTIIYARERARDWIADPASEAAHWYAGAQARLQR
jgi:chromosomal replication initiation ATPase DnaA